MAYIVDSVLEIYNECNILTTTCTLNVGDWIRVGCSAYWSEGFPMQDGVEIKLRFQDLYANTYHDVHIGYTTGGSGWCAGNHQVTKDDIANLGSTGGIRLHAYSDPKAWGTAHGVYYEQPVVTCSQNIRVVTSDGAVVNAKMDWGDGASEYADTPNTFVHMYEKGKSRTATASATGYTSASKTFTTCISQFTLTLQKVVDTCHQSFRVIDKDTPTKRIKDATVTISPSLSCTTNTYGECTIYNLVRNTNYTATVDAAGYWKLKDTFTACTEMRLEKLTSLVSKESFFSFNTSECWIGYDTHKCYTNQPLSNIPSGTIMSVHVKVTNTGTAADTPTFKVMKGTVELDRFTGLAPIEPGLSSALTRQNSFTLDTNKDVRIEVYGSDGIKDSEVGC